jgi:hypothetical protein
MYEQCAFQWHGCVFENPVNARTVMNGPAVLSWVIRIHILFSGSSMYLALTVSLTVYSYMAHPPALNLEAVSSCEMLVSPYKTTSCPITDASNFGGLRFKNS